MQFFLHLPRGTRQTALLLIALYLAAWVLGFFSICHLSAWITLAPEGFWHGKYWLVLSHFLLPGGLMDFVGNLVVFVILAPRVEQAWSRGQLWAFILIGAAGAGLAKVLLTPHSLVPLAGLASVNFGLLAAWFKLFGSEEVLFFGLWKMTVTKMVLLLLAASLLFGWLQNGLFNALIPLGGFGAGWVYLVVRWRRHAAAPGRAVHSERIRRLEL